MLVSEPGFPEAAAVEIRPSASHGFPVRKAALRLTGWWNTGVMALCSEAGVPAAGPESSGSEGSSCLQFGVRSYLHHFYEECSSSMWDRDKAEPGQSQRSGPWWNSAVWKVSLALGLLILTAGVVSLGVSYSTTHKIESFGEGDLFFVDTQAISFNMRLHLSTATGIGLSCLGSALAVAAVIVWVVPRANLKERLLHGSSEGDRRREPGSTRMAGRDVVTKPPDAQEGNVPFTLSKVKMVQPPS
uniref:Neurensin 1-like n=1 Tax=Oryzias sinensis TaxID=183150 RepID=A0A8C7WQZ0_9TELE